MLLTIVAILLLLWILGFIGDIAGSLIHILIVVALAVFIYDRLVARRR